MSKYIELIDKYRIEQNSDDTDYNPPNYIWTDNTGEIVRCEPCKHCDIDSDTGYAYCKAWQRGTQVDWYCSRGEKK